MHPDYKIAVLGFGSLPNQIHSDVHNKTLEVSKPDGAANPAGYNLKPDSPFAPAAGLKLPLRLGRLSGQDTANRRITMILHKNASDEPVFYAKSKFSSIRQAIANLQAREGCPTDRHIGYVDLLRNESKSHIAGVADKVKTWARQNGFNAVVWTDLPEKGVEFNDRSTGREILPLLARDPLLLANTQKYIRDLATVPNILQQHILNIPQPAASQSQLTKWPADIHSLGMTLEEANILKNFVEQNYQALKNSNKDFKRNISFSLNGKNWKLPRTIAFLKDGIPVIHLKNLPPIGSGGQREIKCAYNPLTGKILAKKRILCRSELKLLQNFQQNQPKGIVSPIGIRRVNGREEIKYQAYENRYDQNLHKFLKENPLSFEEKLNMAKNLLNGLKYVHQIDYSFYPEYEFRDIGADENNLDEFEKVALKARHGDIKDDNILLRSTPAGLEAALSDFGCSEPGMPGCPDYISPEGAEDCGNHYQSSRDSFHEPADVWAMGMLIAKILKDEHPAGEVLPLQCMEKIVKAWQRDPVREARFHSLFMSQIEIDAEIERIKSACANDRPGRMKKQLWSLVNKMLQTDQSRRIALNAACSEMEHIV